MKTTQFSSGALILGLLALSSAFSLAAPSGTSFTYQGRLSVGSNPATGQYDLRFTLHDAADLGNQVGLALSNPAVTVNNGLFEVTLDFGASPFAGDARWLEIAVRTNGGSTFTTLSPRQPLTASPYTIYAANAGTASIATSLTGTLPTSQLSGTLGAAQLAGTYSSTVTFNNAANSFTGNGAGLTGIGASSLAPSVDGRYVLKGGDTMTGPLTTPDFFVPGTITALALRSTNGFPLQISAKSDIEFTINASKDPLLLGYFEVFNSLGNHIFSVNEAGNSQIYGSLLANGDLAASRLNIGVAHTLAGTLAGIAGGQNNTNRGVFSGIGGGIGNAIQTGADASAIGGGDGNSMGTGADHSVIGGGTSNAILTNAYRATISGGSFNKVASWAAAVGGGDENEIAGNAELATIPGGSKNKIREACWFSTIAGGIQNHIEPGSGYSTVGGGALNMVTTGEYATVAGGTLNTVSAMGAVVGGGSNNTASAGSAFIGGGEVNNIGGGSSHSTISGGDHNAIQTSSTSATISGGYYNAISNNAFSATIAGGGYNAIGNNAIYAAVPGGYYNVASGNFSLAAGQQAKALHAGSFVWADSTGGAFASTHNDEFNIRAAGGVRIESGLGINLNAANAPLITRGYDPFDTSAPAEKQGLGRWGLFMEPFNLVIGIASVGGRNFQVAKYETDGSRTALLTVDQGGNLYTLGVVNPPSDRAVKQDFATVDSQAVLERVARLPLQTWAYTNAPTIRHLGPIAQDFHAAFDLGSDDKHIATVDADGVALAAIQGLNQKVDGNLAALESELEQKQTEITELKARLEKLEQLINGKNGGAQ